MHICVCGIHEYIIWILYKIKAFRWNILDWVLVKLHLLSQSWAWEVTGPFPVALSLSHSSLLELLSSFAGSQQSQELESGRSRGLGHTETPRYTSWKILALGVNALGISVEISFSGEWSLKAAKKSLPRAENRDCSKDSLSPNCSVMSVVDSRCPLLRV